MASPRNPRTAFVTGASSGIGAALCHRLAARGIDVYAAARRQDALNDLVHSIRQSGGRAHAVAVDVQDAQNIAHTMQEIDAHCGGLDLIVANAGIGGESLSMTKTDFADIKRVIDTNLTGAIATLTAVLPQMLERGFGHIVGISSLAGEIQLPMGATYGATKAALSFWLNSVDIELRPLGIYTTDVRPGFVRTPMTAKNKFPMPFLVEVDDAAEEIDRALIRRDRVLRFPAGLGAVISVAQQIPSSLRGAILQATLPKNPKK